MTLKILKHEFTVCKPSDLTKIRFDDLFCFIGKTADELSLVCNTSSVPDNIIEREDGWRGFYIEGIIDFALTGVLAGILTPLAEARIGIFAVSTYNTDYIFVKEKVFEVALDLLRDRGYNIDKSDVFWGGPVFRTSRS